MAPESIWPGRFQADAGVTASVRSRRSVSRDTFTSYAIPDAQGARKKALDCCTKVIMSGVNGNVIMSGCRDDNPDDERREAARDNTKSVSRGADGGGGRDGDRSQ